MRVSPLAALALLSSLAIAGCAEDDEVVTVVWMVANGLDESLTFDAYAWTTEDGQESHVNDSQGVQMLPPGEARVEVHHIVDPQDLSFRLWISHGLRQDVDYGETAGGPCMDLWVVEANVAATAGGPRVFLRETCEPL